MFLYQKKTSIRIGKFGPYVEKDGGNITIPQDLFLGDLNQEEIDKLSTMQKEDNIIGTFNGGEKYLIESRQIWTLCRITRK